MRLIQVLLPNSDAIDTWESLVTDVDSISHWEVRLPEGKAVANMLIQREHVDEAIDLIREHLDDSCRAIVLNVEATSPRLREEREKQGETDDPSEVETRATETPRAPRIAREELLDDIERDTQLNPVFLTMVVLSAVVAAIGLMRDSVAVIIGAMVIAPLLGPNVGLSLASTLGDWHLAVRSLKMTAIGVGTGLAVSLALGWFLQPDPGGTEIASRTQVDLGDLALALASGCAGALAFTSGVSSTLVGVMVAVALLPPLVVFGMTLACGHMGAAGGALLLLCTNLICVNLAGVATFLVQGIRPRTWWEEERAKRASRWALGVWTLLLIGLIALIVLSGADVAPESIAP